MTHRLPVGRSLKMFLHASNDHVLSTKRYEEKQEELTLSEESRRSAVEWIFFNENKLKRAEDGIGGTWHPQYIDYTLAVCPGKLTALSVKLDVP